MVGMKKRVKSKLKGNQKKLDKNKDGKISGADFKAMQKTKRVPKRGGGMMKKRVKKKGGGMMKKRMKSGGKV
jgi:hypothetical protein